MTAVDREELENLLDELPDGNIRALLEVLKRRDRREPLRRWSSAVGGISDGDAQEMRQAVEEECERIDPEGW